ncbi:MAG: histidine kinase [Reichenbachiella sp.]|uniref:sensor histidine kinase n=1 Tax=Reichenbachiella sp. TaxID=2184521 RepID=UPI0032665C30
MSKLLEYRKPPLSQSLIYLIAVLFSLVVVIQSSKTDGPDIELNLNHIILFTINYLIWAALVPFLYGILNILSTPNKPFTWLQFLIKVLVLILLHFVLSNLVYYGLLQLISEYTWTRFLADIQMVYLRAIASRFIDILVILGLLKIIENYKSLLASKLQLSEIEKQLSQSELIALKAQVNPHFLFNSLHALHSLIGYDDEKAKSITIKISNLLRKNLEQTNKHFVSLEEELAYIKDYMDIELERYHDRLTIRITIDETTKNLLVPNMILQPLVENCFKHGISGLEDEGKISLSATLAGGGLQILISNSTSVAQNDKASAPSIGIGLDNVGNRLKQAYADAYRLDTYTTPGAYHVQLFIPTPS